MGEGVDLGGIDGAVHIAGLVLLGEDHRNAELHRRRGCDGNAAGLNGKHLRHAAAGEEPGDLLAHLAQERGVDLLVEEAPDLQNAAGQDLALGKNLLLHTLHLKVTLLSKNSSEKQKRQAK